MSSNRRGGGNGAGSPVYQIDFTAIGKRIASTKRRVRWRFGFTNQDALSNGETGTACRGEEHDITLVWSITSGKRLILADGQEVHYSISRASICDFSWTMRGNHVLKLVAHASPPMNAQPGFRQYDFFVDGRSFFDMPKVYRLGLTGKDPRGNAPTTVPTAVRHTVEPTERGQINVAKTEAPSNPDEEEAYFKQAIRASMEEKEKADRKRDEELKKVQEDQQKRAAGGDLLLDFTAGQPAPAPAPVASPLPALPAPTPAADPFAPAPAPQPTFNNIATEFPAAAAPAPVQPAAPVMSPAPVVPYAAAPVAAAPQAAPVVPYAAAPATPAALNASYAAPAASDPFAPSAVSAAAPAAPTPAAPAPAAAAPTPAAAAPGAAPALSMFDTPKEETKEASMGVSADQALSKFADMDNFVAPKEPVQKQNPFEAPTPAPSLAGLKAMGGAGQGGQKKDVMNAPPGAMVVSSQQQGNWGGAYAQPGAAGAQPYGQPAAQYSGYGAQQQYQQTQYQQPQQYQGQYQQPQQQQQQYYQQQPPQTQQGFGTMQYPQQR